MIHDPWSDPGPFQVFFDAEKIPKMDLKCLYNNSWSFFYSLFIQNHNECSSKWPKKKVFLRQRNQIFAAKVKMEGLPVIRNEKEINPVKFVVTQKGN